MITVRLCHAGLDLRNWVNAMWPDRDTRSDGWKGDIAHAARKSDHNPDARGIVRAIDIDADLVPGAKDHTEAHRLADTLRNQAKRGIRPIAYIIFDGRITSARSLWRWRKYSGTNPHRAHLHVSFLPMIGE